MSVSPEFAIRLFLSWSQEITRLLLMLKLTQLRNCCLMSLFLLNRESLILSAVFLRWSVTEIVQEATDCSSMFKRKIRWLEEIAKLWRLQIEAIAKLWHLQIEEASGHIKSHPNVYTGICNFTRERVPLFVSVIKVPSRPVTSFCPYDCW